MAGEGNSFSNWWGNLSGGGKFLVGALAVTTGVLILGAFGVGGMEKVPEALGKFMVNTFNGIKDFSNQIGRGINGLFNSPLTVNGEKFVGALLTTATGLFVYDGYKNSGLAKGGGVTLANDPEAPAQERSISRAKEPVQAISNDPYIESPQIESPRSSFVQSLNEEKSRYNNYAGPEI